MSRCRFMRAPTTDDPGAAPIGIAVWLPGPGRGPSSPARAPSCSVAVIVVAGRAGHRPEDVRDLLRAVGEVLLDRRVLNPVEPLDLLRLRLGTGHARVGKTDRRKRVEVRVDRLELLV